MNTLDCIAARKSVRAFEDKAIPREILECIVRAALHAPIGMALFENLHLSVLTSREKVDAFTALCREQSGDPTADPVHGAAAMIVVSGKRPNANVEFANAACMIENMLLAATDLQIGSLYVNGAIGALRESSLLPRFRSLLQLPPEYTPIGSVALGYCKEKFEPQHTPKNKLTGIDYV